MNHRPWIWRWGLVFCCLSIAGCAPRDLDLLPRSTRPIVKIGLVAPFEGRDRALGYEVLYAVRWAVRERNARGGLGGAMVELVALNDNGDPDESAFQARKLAVDTAMMGAIGPFSPAAAGAAVPVYRELGLPAVIPATCPGATAGGGLASEDRVFCLSAGADVLAEALLDRLPEGAQATLLWADADPLQAALAARVPADRHVALAGMEGVVPPPAEVYLYSGSALAAAELLPELRGAGITSPLWGGPQLARSQLPQVAGPAVKGTCYAMTAALYADEAFAAGYSSLAGYPPGPWAALAYDAAQLVLDAIERDVLASGRAARAGVAEQLSQGRDSEAFFIDGQRRQAEFVFYCYERGEAYPGRVVDP